MKTAILTGFLLVLIAIVANTANAAPPPWVKLSCQGSDLINSQTGLSIRKFTFDSDCQEALNSRRGELLCADSGIKTDLMNIWGDVLKTITWKSDCTKALESRRGHLFCVAHGSHYQLMTVQGATLEDYTWESECTKALNGAYEQFVCKRAGNNYELVNQYIRRTIATFVFSSKCEDAKVQAPTGLICIDDGRDYTLINERGSFLQKFAFSSECEKERADRLANPINY